ncbi:MAG: glutathione S-transferase [Planctomycetota bacterium]|nr:glutathione S-transferase [Planctomycetota bacterium]
MTQVPIRLISIPMSHYCDKVRWALELKKIPFTEEFHMPVFQIRAAKKAGGRGTVPVLVTPEKSYGDSTDILKFLDQIQSEPRLYPEEMALRKEVEDFEELCDEKLGPHTRRIAFSLMLGNKALMLSVLQHKTPPGQFRAFNWGFFFFRFLIRKGMNITPASVERSVKKVDEIFTVVEAQLEKSGGPYLFGDSISAADITFATMAMPAILPRPFFIPLPDMSALDPARRQLVEDCRSRPAGAYALKLYKEERSFSGS